MDIRATNEMSVILNFELQANLNTLLEEGGFEEFEKLAKEKLNQQLDSLRGLAAMKKIVEAQMTHKAEAKSEG